ncbi:hypothetical protein DXG03_002428 [Asterophora parasitica]|uniref:GDP/GTP exchange factor Sec2 N-terminal domain-containing protein n=1 Tax=Asterophora parasitica TaxID=117018 RepID=A0A9P7GBD9_9AGAR|nr:hypothetical protein DXG03_002428 [Asterophora parasitica]
MAKASGLEDLQKGKTSEETLEVIPEVERVADTPKINGASTTNGLVGTTTTHALKRHRTRSDPDAQDMVIASLRSQIQDLFSQVTQLNTKLVNSYDRVSDLEDDLHVASATVRSSTLKISQLELERTQHLSALNTGLLVEKSHVTSELNRLMEKATEEAAQRGQAESARRDIEKDLDDLSATLFGQANTMVAEARFAQHLSEQKVAEAERALKGAEEAVGVMQQQMQALQSDKEEAEERAEKALVAMGKGKHTERRESPTFSIRLLSSHLPYQEFLLFVAHLRSIHISSPQPPAITTLLPLPFLTRLLNEDSIIEKVWEEEVPTLLPPTIATSPTTEKPPVPPRRRGLWGMASALGERATSWGGEGDKDKAKKAAPAAPEAKPTELRRLPPPPPPIHPTVKEADVPVRRNLPPPLPKRSEVRHQATSAEKTPPESTPTTHAIAPTADEPSPTPAHKEPALPPRPPRRPITPESVPLPDSRPPTPLVAPVPAPAAIATGSPVPPPLPRRAAARASRVIADGAVSRPATPQASEPIAESKEEDFTAAKVEPTETKADVEAEVATSPVDESNGASEQASEEGPALTPGGDPAPPADTPVAVDESAAKVASEDVSSSSEASPGSEGEVSAEASTVTEPTAKEGVNGEEAVVDAPAVKNEPEAKKVADGADSSPEGVNAGTASPEEVAPPPYGEEKQALAEPEKEKKDEEAKDGEETEPAASEVESEETSAVVARDTKSDDQSEKKAEDDKEAYIGDTTWEERTWKEIVRLKEEMFWARIGGVRQSE